MVADVVNNRIRNLGLCNRLVTILIKNPKKNDIHNDIKLHKHRIKDFFKNSFNKECDNIVSYSDLMGDQKNDFISEEIDKPLTLFDLFYLYGILHQKQLEFIDNHSIKTDNFSSHNIRKIEGAFYTHYAIAYHIVKQCFEHHFKQEGIKKLSNLKVLEPCVGTGMFIIAMIDYLLEEVGFKSNVRAFVNFIENSVYCVDIDTEAIELFKTYLPVHLKNYFGVEIETSKLAPRIRRADILLDRDLKEELKERFDIIFFNPPYELLKPNLSEFKDISGDLASIKFADHKLITNELKNSLKQSGLFNYSLQGMLNLYKLFIELTCEIFSKSKAQVGFIVPFTLLGDYQCKNLRKNLIYNHSIKSISVIPENNIFFQDITQAFCIVNLSNSSKTTAIKLKNNVTKIEDLFDDKGVEFDYSSIRSISSTDVIFPFSKIDLSILKKIYKYSKLGELKDHFGNFRGEIDLTKYKEFIVEKKTRYPLVRGRDIGYFNDIPESIKLNKVSYIENYQKVIELLFQSDKISHLKKMRIACQQISNLKTLKRLRFSIIPPNYLLANSCNYLLIEKVDALDKEFCLDYFTLLCFLNSSIYDWRFKLTSTNNHISNNELDDLPIPLDKNKKWIFENLKIIFKKFKNGYVDLDRLEALIDSHVFKLFELSPEEINYILKQYKKSDGYIKQVIYISDKLESSYIYNHQISGLSKLDMEMIRHVPPGGNWKNIPKSIPSKRLKRIRETGGRTTLYGRMRRDRPSYTISTYFNRQGNGTYIHPDYYPSENTGYAQNRLISFREAARLQSFKDSFAFFGSKSSLLKQIGNAVPPLLAYHLAVNIKERFSLKRPKIVDLFCGAGGLSHGFKEAGCDIVLGLDNFPDSVKTFKMNNPGSSVICGDIRNSEIKELLCKKITGTNIDIIVGGPPCQGFSHAGKRIIDDPRNFLFREFVEIVRMKKPSIFLMENVEGILSLNKAKTYNSIVECFRDIGYDLAPRKLNAAEFGVPQLRKRIFIIGCRKRFDDKIFPKAMFRLINNSENEQYGLFSFTLPSSITVEEAIGDLAFIDKGLGEFNTRDPFPLGLSEYQSYMRGIISFEEFYEKRKTRLELKQLRYI